MLLFAEFASEEDAGMSWFILLLLAAIWGASYLFIKIGVDGGFQPLTFVALRTLIAGIALFIVMQLRGEKFPRTRAIWYPMVVMALFNSVVPYSFITWGEQAISSGLAAILTAMVPFFTVVFANFWTRDERLTRTKLVGIAIGLVGVAILFAPAMRQGVKVEFWGMLAVVGASASYGFAILVARKFLGELSHLVASTSQLGGAALVMIPLSVLFEHPFNLQPTTSAIVALVTLALLGTAFAYILYYWLIHNIGATRTSLVTYIMPIMGVVWGALILSEKIDPTAIVGLVLIIGGILVVSPPRLEVDTSGTVIVEGD